MTSYLYLYCIAQPAAACAAASLEGVEPGATPFVVGAAGLAAVVSRVPAAEYGEAPLHERLGDLEWLGRRGLAHERVVESCCRAGAALPLRFGTIFSDAARIESLLDGHAARLHELLRELAGTVEWILGVHVDREVFDAEHARRAAPQPVKTASSGAGRAYLEGKRAAARARDTSRTALVEALAEIHARHRAAALRAVRQPPAESGDRALDAAYLVRAAEAGAFAALSREEAAACEPWGLRLRLSGPWPPYSFVGPLEGGR